jgi:flavin-dependent dehydrogenase
MSPATWDAIVIGAGPAGSIAALRFAETGASVLLVDQGTFPRPKVCGSCLNPAGLAVLARYGLRDLCPRAGAIPLTEYRVSSRGHRAVLRADLGVALSRERLDAALIDAAIAGGVRFRDATVGSVGDLVNDARRVHLSSGGGETSADARAVVVATGLGARSFQRHDTDHRRIAPRSRIGVGAVIDDDGSPGIVPPGRIEMSCAESGYAGLVRLEDGRIDVAAALDARALRERSIGDAVAGILEDAGVTVPSALTTAPWRGTPPLTQGRSAVAGERYFVVGDAAGYVEPFTGEGMAWALATGEAAAAIASADPRASARWTAEHRRLTARRMRTCRRLSATLRRPALVSLGVRLLARAPALARPLIKALAKGG